MNAESGFDAPYRAKFFLLLLLAWLLVSVSAVAVEPPSVRLGKGQTVAPDGFSVRINAGPQSYVAPTGAPFGMIWFTLTVPQKVGKTDFAACQFMIQDKRGRTVLSVPLRVSNDKIHKQESVQFQVQDPYTKGCELHFMYQDEPGGQIVRKYVLPLEDYLPAKH